MAIGYIRPTTRFRINDAGDLEIRVQYYLADYGNSVLVESNAYPDAMFTNPREVKRITNRLHACDWRQRDRFLHRLIALSQKRFLRDFRNSLKGGTHACS